MWQSRVEIENYSVAYFDRVVTEVLRYSAVLPLRAGLIRAAKLHQCLISRHSAYEHRP